MIQIILKFTFLSQIFPDQQHGNLVIHQLFSTQYLFQLNNSATQQLSNSVTQQLSNSVTQQLSNSATQQLSNSFNSLNSSLLSIDLLQSEGVCSE